MTPGGNVFGRPTLNIRASFAADPVRGHSVCLRICGILNIIEALLPARSRWARSTTAPPAQPERGEAEEKEAVTAKNIVRARARSMST